MINIRSIALASSFCLAAAAPVASQETIADIVVRVSGGATAGQFDRDARDYDILLNALQTAGLVGAVADPNAELTVFAPNDRAFMRLARDLGFTGRGEEATWNFLVAALTRLGGGDPVPVLTTVLLYHVAPGEVSAFSVILRTLFGRVITTAADLDPDPMVDDFATIRPFFLILVDNDPDVRNPIITGPINLRASNGLIHGINRVLLPIDLP